MNMHPVFQEATRILQRTQVADLPSAWVDATAELTIGSLWIADIEGRVSVHREGAYLVIDDIEINGQRQGRKAVSGIGKDVAGRLRELTPSQQQEHLCACAFHDLIDDPRFIERAEEALAEAEREWRLG